MKKDSLRGKTLLEKRERKSRNSLKVEILQLWNSETEEIEYYKGKRLIRSFLILATVLTLTSCVSKKVLVEEQNRSKQYSKNLKSCEDTNQSLQAANKDLSGKIILLENQVANEQSKTNILDQQMNYYQSANTNLLDRLTDLSVVSKTGAESIKKSLEAINDHKQLDILVEGHTDDVPISTPLLVDNWDLSVKRATSVVRLLQTKYAIAPERMTAGGRSEFVPKTSNSTVEGKAANRRTEIIILPKLDEFFELLEPTTGK